MSLFEGVANSPPATQCACCSRPSAGQTWGVELCSGCHAAWFVDPRFESGVIDKAIGAKPWVQGEATDRTGELERYAAEAIKRTRAWVSERARRAA